MPPKMKNNPRKAELKEALTQIKSTSDSVPAVLQGASSAMTSKAWTGGTSGEFGSGLSDHVTQAKKGGTASVDEVQAAYDTCPAEIPDPDAQEPK